MNKYSWSWVDKFLQDEIERMLRYTGPINVSSIGYIPERPPTMNFIQLTDAAGGPTYVNLNNVFLMRRFSVADTPSFTRLFASAVSTIETPESIRDRVGPIHTQALYVDVIETPEAIMSVAYSKLDAIRVAKVEAHEAAKQGT